MISRFFQKPPLGAKINFAHPLAKGLVGCWLMNEGHGDRIRDLSQFGNHGKIEGMAFPSTPESGWNAGKFGRTLKFDGSNDYVNCGNDSSLDITDAITIEAWVKLAEDKTCYVVGRTDYSSAGGYSLYWTGTDNKIIIYYGSSQKASSNAVFTDLNDWVHAVIVIDSSGNVSFYRNGQAAGTAGPITLASYNGNLILGNRNGLQAAFNAFNGSIDGVKIYNRALSAENIIEEYQNPFGIFEKTKFGILVPNAEKYYSPFPAFKRP